MLTREWLFLSLFSVFIAPHCCFRAEATIGILFNEITWQPLLPLRNALKKQNMVDQAFVRFSTEIQQVSATDSFNVSKTVCDLLGRKNGVAAIISVQGSETSPIQESICFNSELPFISMSWGPTQENNISMSLNFYPEARLFAKGLMEVVKALRWNSFVILYETEEGLIRMQEILKLQEFHRGKRNSILVKQLGPGPDYRMLLKEIRNASEYIILDCETENIIPILLQAKDLRMLELHNNYFLTSLDAHTLDYSILKTTANITTIRLFDPNRQEFQNVLNRWLLSDNENEDEIMKVLPPHTVLTETVLLYDAFTHIMECIKSLAATSSVETNPISCEEKSKSKNGFALYNFCRVKKPEKTLTGAVKFDEFGNRIHFKIDIVDADMPTTALGSWHSHNESMVLYRGENETFDASVANLQKIKVIVSSRMGPPYLMPRSASYEGEVLTGNARYKGYSMDLISKIAEIIGFQFEFRLTEDGKYGNWDVNKKKWTGLIGDLLERKAHLAICDLTITHERREVADFSMPFMTLGISILHKKQDKKDINMFAFLDPFSVGVWIYTATLYLIMSIVLYFISRMTPGDWENPHPCEENPEELENIWDIKNCLWLTLGSIMTQGCDILPK
ncbi:unnamed protein product [Acanthoscelides obtectus]|nr:unnamed protein product [Acanthoscelides obtectus]CAK1622623.1 Glutamate receptor ionotropic, kainate 1 [Acanthoscelides obtectus]